MLAEPDSAKKVKSDYDQSVRQMTLDKRAAPTNKTMTEEEKAEAEASRLKELETKRLKRMRGEKEKNKTKILMVKTMRVIAKKTRSQMKRRHLVSEIYRALHRGMWKMKMSSSSMKTL